MTSPAISQGSVNYAYDPGDRTSALTGNLGGGATRNYSTEIIYSSLGGLSKEKFGTTTAVYNKLFYNSRVDNCPRFAQAQAGRVRPIQPGIAAPSLTITVV
jgi:hypothetical protein